MGLYVVTTIATMFVSPFLFEGILKNPYFWVIFLLLLAAACTYRWRQSHNGTAGHSLPHP